MNSLFIGKLAANVMPLQALMLCAYIADVVAKITTIFKLT
jgi:hypothetical protein